MKNLREMSSLKRIVISSTLVGSLLTSGCGGYWGTGYFWGGISHEYSCRNPECPGHTGVDDKCAKSTKTMVKEGIVTIVVVGGLLYLSEELKK